MCGIVGAISSRDVNKILLAGLASLEYRGYDSAVLCTIDNGELKVLHKFMLKTSRINLLTFN